MSTHTSTAARMKYPRKKLNETATVQRHNARTKSGIVRRESDEITEIDRASLPKSLMTWTFLVEPQPAPVAQVRTTSIRRSATIVVWLATATLNLIAALYPLT